MAIRTRPKLARPQPRNPRPPARSGWVGVSSRPNREMRKRNLDQSRKIQSQRRRKKNRIGRLTRMYHQPASVIPASDRFQVDSSEPNRITTCAMIAVVTARTRMTPSATTDSRRRSASAFAASSLTASPAGTTPDARNCRSCTPRLRSTTISASASRGSTNRKRLRITGSRSKVTATRLPKAWPATRDRSTSGTQVTRISSRILRIRRGRSGRLNPKRWAIRNEGPRPTRSNPCGSAIDIGLDVGSLSARRVRV